MSDATDEKKPAKWWQVMLTTPALLLALGGGLGTAVPAIWAEVKAWRLGVETARVQIAEEQQRLWTKNLPCLALKPVYTITISEHVEVGVTLCSSGDTLLKYQRAPGVATYTWVPFPPTRRGDPALNTKTLDLQNPINHVVYGATRCVMLQGQIVLWVLYRDEETQDQCRMDYIATLSGRVLSSQDVPCSTCES
jgi:hypothetical protein